MTMTREQLNATLKELASYTQMANELDATITQLKETIKEYLVSENLDEILGENGEHVVFREVVSTVFDSTAFKKSEWAELYKEYSKQRITRPFKFFA